MDTQTDRPTDRHPYDRLSDIQLVYCTLDRHVEKESLADYIAKKREMFLVEVCFILSHNCLTSLLCDTNE